MNNKQNNVNRGLLDTQRNDTNRMYQDYINSTKDFNTGLMGQVRDTYSNPDNFMSVKPNSTGWFDLPNEPGGGGGAAGGDYSSAKKGFQSFADTGGVNRADFNPALDSYKNFISTGGVGESEANALRARATAQIPAAFTALKNNLARRNSVQGGYSPGYDEQTAALGRDTAREGFQASRQVEGDIVDKRLQGRMFGTAGYGNLQSDITGKEQSGKLAGLSGLKGIGDSEQQNSQFNAGLGETRAARNQRAQLELQGMFQHGRETGAAGLSSLYNTTSGNELNARNNMSSTALQNIMARLGIKDARLMDYLGSILSGAGGVAGAFTKPTG